MPALTPNFGFEYPLSNDPLADGAQTIQDFATTADTALADLKGGTTGQALFKNSNTDMDFIWSSVTTNIGVPSASGYYYNGIYDTVSDITAVEDTTYYQLFYVPISTTFDRIAVRSGAAHSGTSTIRMGIYNMGAAVPTTVLLDAGTASVSATNTVAEITINQTLAQGWYWLAANVQTRTGTQQMKFGGWTGRSNWLPMQPNTTTGAGTVATTNYTIAWQQAGVTGAFATAASLTASSSPIIVALRRA